MARDVDRFLLMQGTIACKVKGAGAWTLHLGDLDAPVTEGFDARAELKVWFTAQGFEGFVSGSSKARELVRKGDIVYHGDTDLLQHLGFLMTPGDSPLGIRLAGF
ncbi:MAG: SCP2 sterol-binding domain-containing protein [Pseudomonadota bacterium]